VSFWVGDGLGPVDAQAFLRRGKRQAWLHVLSSLELDIRWLTNDVAYLDEGPVHVKEYQGQLLKQEDRYAAGLGRWRARLEAELKARGAAYVGLSDATPIAAYQQALLTVGALTAP
jgi:hypothetical protein